MNKIYITLITIGLFSSTSFGIGLGDLTKVAGGGDSSGGVSISEVFDTYIIALNKVQLGQDAMNAAFEDAGEQQKVLAQMENYDSSKADADAAKATAGQSKEAAAKAKENLAKLNSLTAEQKETFSKGAAFYLLAVPDLIKLSKQVKDVKKPGFSDVKNLGKFKELAKLPGFVKNVISVVPNLLTAHKNGEIELPKKATSAADLMN